MRQRFLLLVGFFLVLGTLLVVVKPAFSSQAKPEELPAKAQELIINRVNPETPESAGMAILPSPTLTPEQPTPAAELERVQLPTQAQMIPYNSGSPMVYFAQSGDSLDVLAVRFGVSVADITSADPLPEHGFISEGQLLLIPANLEEVSSTLKLFPDSEVVNSPSALDFDLPGFIQAAGGYLADYNESVYGLGYFTSAEIVERVALDFSIHPRLLLALLEYESGWIYGMPRSEQAYTYPLGFVESGKSGLYNQLVVAAGHIGTGYYGWREATQVAITFPDGTVLRLAAELNCGSVGLMAYFAQNRNLEAWASALYLEDGFLATYEVMFGNPWAFAQAYGPLFYPHLSQPEMTLPFESGVTWSYTSGPHAAWGAMEVRAALDFAPPSDATGCLPNGGWVVSSTPGLVVRAVDGLVVVDLDGDGKEQTGWNIIYMHIGTTHRVKVGTWLETGDRIGHPSCEGGISTGTHLHIARKYNGEWVPAEGPLTFDLSGWKVKSSSVIYTGWLIRGDEIIRSNRYGNYASHISRND